jgi:hypothetical protein
MANPQEMEPDASSPLPIETVEPDGASSHAIGNWLPVVRRQRGGEAPMLSRYALLVAALALAAVLGFFVGSLSTLGFAQIIQPQPAAKSASSGGPQASLDSATRSVSSQVAKIADRIERFERAVNEQSTKLAQVAEAVNRLETRSAAAGMEATGAITAKQATPEPNITDQVLDDWIVQGVRHGRALVQRRQGGVFVVRAGASLPDLGRVEAIKRQDGQWVVVTARGLITSGP